jgi:protein gp37
MANAQSLEVVDPEVETPALSTPLTKTDKAELKRYEDEIESGIKAQKDGLTVVANGFLKMVAAMHSIHKGKLYRGDKGLTFEAYCSNRWHYSRAHGNRLVLMGELLEKHKMSPRGDILKSFTSAEHFLPLLAVPVEKNGKHDSDAAAQERDSKVAGVLDRVKAWHKSKEPITPRLVQSAASVTNPPTAQVAEKDEVVAKVREFVGKATADILKHIAKVRAGLGDEAPRKTISALAKIEKKTAALGGRSRSTNITWTEATWNPLEGCTRASKGCDHCYAAKFMATRAKHRFPGFAEERMVNGEKRYFFLGKIQLQRERLGDPLSDSIPKLYFVNSMSDLFHEDVPVDFINEVFDVMERANWHVFQVLTKRPKIMADYTVKRYAEKTPPPNIWLGTSTEDQDAFDKRYPHLLRAKTAVRWLSCEPLVGSLTLKMKDINWVVVGGESGSNRPMEKRWATGIRDQCAKANVPFFFKQWGSFDQNGKKKKRVTGKKKHEEKLEGKPHDKYPSQLREVIPDC